MSYKIKTLTQVRNEIQSGNPFTLTYCTFDETRNTGGERATIDRCVLVQSKKKKDVTLSGVEARATSPAEDKHKNPHHLWNGTFNVSMLINNRVKKIHWLLIELYNGYQVVM